MRSTMSWSRSLAHVPNSSSSRLPGLHCHSPFVIPNSVRLHQSSSPVPKILRRANVAMQGTTVVAQHEHFSTDSTNGTLDNNGGSDADKQISPILQLARQFNCFFLNKLNALLTPATAPSTGLIPSLTSSYRPFIIDGYQVGLVPSSVTLQLRNYPNVFHIYNDAVELNPQLGDYVTRSDVVEGVLREFRKKDLFITLKGWREECYEVKSGFDDPALMKMERSATCLFGIRQYGVDINGYVNHPTKGLCLWLQKRANNKPTWPGKLDNMVGGGLAVGYTVLETALKEAGEEASIPDELLANLKPAGTVSFYFESERGLFPNTEFVFDLELPIDFVPVNQDGEVQSFHLVTAKEALEIILAPEFKTTSCPVTLDFLVRHGVITTQNEPDFPQLMELLHVPLHSIYKQLTANDFYYRNVPPS